ncbi:hypothetical protein GCM10010393_33110 [Streptomyces gobitricini]|uniref:Transposase n=1 Tax=Streptomyces gobitricini TaxID=68211 RepID=A0ABN3MA62_9ACTN
MAEPTRVRKPTDQEGRKLQQIVRRGRTGSVRFRRAMVLSASADGNRVPVIAQLVQADQDTVREVLAARAPHRLLRWRDASVRHPDVLAAPREGRARIRCEKGIRRGGRPLTPAASPPRCGSAPGSHPA